MKRTISFLALALAAGLAGCANSMQARAPEMDRGTGLTSIDQPFVRDATNNAAYEVEASKLALTRSSTPEVRKVAQRIIDDNNKTSDQLLRLARDHGESIAAEPTFDQQQKLDQLKKLDSGTFDAQYLRQMERTHRDTIAEFKSESQYGQNDDVRSVSNKTLPKLEEQLRTIRGEMGPAVSSEGD